MVRETSYIVQSPNFRNVTDNEPFKQIYFANEEIDAEELRNGLISNYTIKKVYIMYDISNPINFRLFDISEKNIIFGIATGSLVGMTRRRFFNRTGFDMDYDLGNQKSIGVKGIFLNNRFAIKILKTTVKIDG